MSKSICAFRWTSPRPTRQLASPVQTTEAVPAQCLINGVCVHLVERWFREITDKRIRRGVFRSVPELVTAITEYLDHNNAEPKPFVWTKSVEAILEKVGRCKAIIETLH